VHLVQPGERPLQAVKHLAEQARAEPHRELRAGCHDRLAETEAARALVDLHGRALLLQPDDFAHEPGASDDDAFVKPESLEIDADRRSGDPDDASVHGLNLTW
jgi:hypothetical protein